MEGGMHRTSAVGVRDIEPYVFEDRYNPGRINRGRTGSIARFGTDLAMNYTCAGQEQTGKIGLGVWHKIAYVLQCLMNDLLVHRQEFSCRIFQCYKIVFDHLL